MNRLSFAFVALLPQVVFAQTARPLGASQREHQFEFSSVSDVRELSDGRLIVVDRRERAIQLVDFARGTATRIGREGAGPKEIQQPTTLLALPSDTTAVWDGRNARLLYIGPDGTALRTDRIVADDGTEMTIDVRAPRYADAQGRLYFAGIPAGRTDRDSIPLIRYDRRTARIDTVGTMLAPKAERATIGPPEQQMTMAITNPFGPQQEWFVTADGRVGVVRSPELRVDWTHPVKRTGAAIPFSAARVTETDKERWRNGQRTTAFVRDANSRGSEPAIQNIPEPSSWPTHKPPFLGATGSVLVDQLGRVWVLRATAVTDSIPVYDVFEAESRVAMRVSLPKKHRVAGFGRNVVYTVRADDDDLLRINRHALPRSP